MPFDQNILFYFDDNFRRIVQWVLAFTAIGWTETPVYVAFLTKEPLVVDRIDLEI